MPQDIPNIIRGVQTDYKKLYYSESDAALKVPVTLIQGYGLLKQGTVLARDTSTATPGRLFPYDPSLAVTGAENAPGRSYLVANQGTGTKVCSVSIADSYRFAIGDDIIICDSDLEANMDDGGPITGIDRTTYTNFAVITFTTNTGDDFTVAKFAHVMHKGCFVAVGILEKSVDCGVGLNSKGALATLILGNCVLYSGMLLNMDSGAVTDLSAGTFGQYTYIR